MISFSALIEYLNYWMDTVFDNRYPLCHMTGYSFTIFSNFQFFAQISVNIIRWLISVFARSSVTLMLPRTWINHAPVSHHQTPAKSRGKTDLQQFTTTIFLSFNFRYTLDAWELEVWGAKTKQIWYQNLYTKSQCGNLSSIFIPVFL